jgi:uncharacterized protein
VSDAKNVFSGALEVCANAPVTGFYRTGCCDTGPEDTGGHTVCAQMTKEFLLFSKRHGNDLMAPLPGFPGLKPGDRWCLCATRWKEALQADAAPPVVLAATHEKALEILPIETLKAHALDLN